MSRLRCFKSLSAPIEACRAKLLDRLLTRDLRLGTPQVYLGARESLQRDRPEEMSRISFTGSGFQIEEIFGSLDRISQRAIGGVEGGGIAEADGLLGLALVLIKVGMKCAAEFVEFVFELARSIMKRRGKPRQVK